MDFSWMSPAVAKCHFVPSVGLSFLFISFILHYAYKRMWNSVQDILTQNHKGVLAASGCFQWKPSEVCILSELPII